MLPEPLEYPPPDPPFAFAKEIVGTPTRENAIVAAMSFVVFKTCFLSMDFADRSRAHHYPTAMVGKNVRFEKFRVVPCSCPGDDSSVLFLTGISTTMRHGVSQDLLLRLKPVIERTLMDASFIVLEGSRGDPFVKIFRNGRCGRY
jgi:hypothetical protein